MNINTLFFALIFTLSLMLTQGPGEYVVEEGVWT